ncbi:MAG: alkaline phosphatase family protein [Bryobacterales bacterium]|nr:alkaline phosphatase family protein [Bryobacterales bacterium]
MKTFILALATLLTASLAPAAAVPVKKPKLVVLIVVDQFRYDYLTRFRTAYTAGFSQLLTKGAVFTNAHYEHMPTVTAIGHSITLTGAMPALSGIVGNEWYDRTSGKQVTSVSDTDYVTLGAPDRKAASPKRLLVSTVGDELKMSGKGSKVIGLSMKDRSAILPAGHMADAAYWWDSASGNFVTSSYYVKALPPWVEEFNKERSVDRFAGQQWSSLDGSQVFVTLPATPGKPYYDAVYASTFGNEVLESFAESCVKAERLGLNGGTDLLSVSFSSNDAVGHKVGPDSPLMRDITLRTDRLLGKFFDVLDKQVGMANVLVVMTADHGVAPLPEKQAERKMPGGRMTEQSVLNAVQEELSEKYGPGKWVLGKSGPSPYLDHNLIKEKKLSLEEVQRTAAQTVLDLPNIARVFTREDLRKGLALNDQIGRRVQNGFFYDRATDLVIVPRPYFLFEKSGTSHGTPYNYDSHVPVLFMGPGIKAGSYNERIAVNDIAATLATYLEIEVPSGCSGRALDEIYAAN